MSENLGLLDYAMEAAHIATGMEIPYMEALELVVAAHEFAERDDRPILLQEAACLPVTIEGNVIRGVPFGQC